MEADSTEKKIVSSEEYAHLKQIECMETCQKKLVEWAKWKFWAIALVVSVVVGLVGFFGGKSLIRESVRETVKERLDVELDRVIRAIERAEDALDETREAGTRAEVVVENADSLAKGYAKTVSQLQEALVVAQDNLDVLRQKVNTAKDKYDNLSGETGHVRGLIARDVNGLTVRLTALEEFVRRVAKQTTADSTEALLVAYEAEVRKAADSTEKQKEDFEENARYHVRVYSNKARRELADKVYNKFAMVGFKASNLDMERAKERLWPAETRTPYTQAKITQTSGWFSEDIITNTTDVDRKKVDEVTRVIQQIVEQSDPKALTWEFFAKRYGDPFLAQSAPSEFFKTNLIEVYLAGPD